MSGTHYSDSERARVADLHLEGLSAPKIAQQISRPASAVRRMLHQLGLVKERLAHFHLLRSKREMTRAQHEQFVSFLRSYSQKCAPAELVTLWEKHFVSNGFPEVTYDKVVHWMKKTNSGVAENRQAISAAYPKAKVLRRRSLRQQARVRCEEADPQFLNQLNTLAKTVFRKNPRHPARDCQICSESWPLTKDFFYFHRGRAGKTGYYSIRCRACDKQRRRWVSDLRVQGKSEDEILSILKGLYRRLCQDRAEERRKSAFDLHQQMLKKGRKRCTRKCVHCETEWLLRKDAYRYDPKRQKYSQLCIFCEQDFHRRISNAIADGLDPEPIRNERRNAYERAHDERAAEEHQAAKTRARTLLAANQSRAKRTCPCCNEPYPLDTKHFRRDLRGSLQYICRWCRAQYERRSKRLRDQPGSLRELRNWYARLIGEARATERAEKNADLRALAARMIWKNRRRPLRKCPGCQHPFPLTNKFWRFHSQSESRNGHGKPLLNSKYCVCCQRDSAAAKYRMRKG